MQANEYCFFRLQELHGFFKKVQEEGADLLRVVLNEAWCENVKAGAQKVWLGKQKDYDCIYFPVRWLMEEKNWPLINSGLIDLESKTNKKRVLKDKLKRIVLDDWMQAMSAAFEIAALCRFVKDGVLIEIEPKVSPSAGKHADALIKVDSRGILVELTSMTKALASPEQRVGVLSLKQMEYQVISKIKDKAETQLSFAEQPTILIISLPPRIGSDHLTAKWAIEECLHNYSKITAVLVSDSYLFRCGAWYFNDKAKFKFNGKEKNYITNLLKLNRSLASSRYSEQLRFNRAQLNYIRECFVVPTQN